MPASNKRRHPKVKTVPQLLAEGTKLYAQRQKLYGENYKHFGTVMVGLFPGGITLKTAKDWARMGLILNSVTKLGRYCGSMNTGGHRDSARDLKVYAAMLEEMTDGN